MAVDKLVDSAQLNTDLTSVADAIRAKGGTSAPLAFPSGFVTAVNAIPTGGGSVIQPLSVTANGTYTAPSGVDGYSPVTVDVSLKESDVNFYDYDGTLLYSFTTAEVNDSGFTMPSNPSHTGLTAQGWNWTLAQVRTQLAAVPTQPVDVGQMYITDDGKTRIYVHLEAGRLHPYLGICPNGTVVVDWGDNTSTATLTGTSVTTVQIADHVYASEGDYTITLTVSSGSFYFYGTTNCSYLLRKNTSTSTGEHHAYFNAITKVEIGTNALLGNFSFCECCSLKSITLPTASVSSATNLFQYCYTLKYAVLPSDMQSIGNYTFHCAYSLLGVSIPCGITSIGQYAFRYCYALQRIALPSGITTIGQYAFQGCYSLTTIALPDGITNINQYLLNNCQGLETITMPSRARTINANSFNGCNTLKGITIPSTVTSIGNASFASCYNFTILTIPSNVATIGTQAFASCNGLAEIHFKPTTPPTASSGNAWTSIPTDCIIYVPAGTLEAYTTASYYPSPSTYTYVEE